jgi:hypothetical protein
MKHADAGQHSTCHIDHRNSQRAQRRTQSISFRQALRCIYLRFNLNFSHAHDTFRERRIYATVRAQRLGIGQWPRMTILSHETGLLYRFRIF